jgi:hypothetical protein
MLSAGRFEESERLTEAVLDARLRHGGPSPMLPTKDLFVHVYVLVDDAVADGAVAIPPRPAPVPACSDAEVLTIALVRHLPGRRSEAGWLAEVRCDWAHLFPRLPAQSEFNRRARWLRGAFEALRARLAARCPEDSWQQTSTSALPVRHPSRVHGPDGWTGPAGLAAGFGRDAAHAEWFYGFRLAIRTDLGSRIVRSRGSVPAAACEREVADDLPAASGRRPGCCQAAGSPAAPSPPGTAHRAPLWSWPIPAPSATSSARPSAAGSPRCATGSRPATGRSPTVSSWPVTERTPSGACSLGSPPPWPPTPCYGSNSYDQST